MPSQHRIQSLTRWIERKLTDEVFVAEATADIDISASTSVRHLNTVECEGNISDGFELLLPNSEGGHKLRVTVSLH